jgi:hypothetical protein
MKCDNLYKCTRVAVLSKWKSSRSLAKPKELEQHITDETIPPTPSPNTTHADTLDGIEGIHTRDSSMKINAEPTNCSGISPQQSEKSACFRF